MVSNHFKKSFSVKPCVWLCMENRIFRKSILFDRKIVALTRKLFYVFILPSNHFWKRETERERERRESRESLLMTDCATRKAELAEIVQSFDRRDRQDRLLKSSAEIAEIILRDRWEIDGFLSSSKASIFTFSSNEIDGSDHSNLKRMDRWVMACELVVVGIGGVGPWVVGCGRLCGFLLGCGGLVDSHCWCGWVVEVDLWWCWLFFFF